MSASPPTPPSLPLGPTRNCPKCGMAVPAKAHVCAYCKKRLRTGPVALGCAAVLALFVVIAVIINSSESPSSSSSPAPSAEQAKNQEQGRKRIAEEQRAAEERYLKTKPGQIWEKHKEWGRDICRLIADGEIVVGMTKDQVRASWGRPQSVNSTVSSSGTDEQWVYGVGQYVYFENGVMTMLQQQSK